jgi:hypothetical protein
VLLLPAERSTAHSSFATWVVAPETAKRAPAVPSLGGRTVLGHDHHRLPSSVATGLDRPPGRRHTCPRLPPSRRRTQACARTPLSVSWQAGRERRKESKSWILQAVAACLALAALGVAVAVVHYRGDNKGHHAAATTTTTTSTTTKSPTTVTLTADGLGAFAKTRGRPVYWLGPKLGADYQVTTTSDGRVYVLYLPASSQPSKKTQYLSVGTYPLKNAYAATVKAASTKGLVALKAGAGVAAVYATRRPTNVFVAFPGIAYQIEVFDPNAAQAHKFVVAHNVVPVP